MCVFFNIGFVWIYLIFKLESAEMITGAEVWYLGGASSLAWYRARLNICGVIPLDE